MIKQGRKATEKNWGTHPRENLRKEVSMYTHDYLTAREWGNKTEDRKQKGERWVRHVGVVEEDLCGEKGPG